MWCFAGFFAKNGCANRGFLRGKRGEVVVNCVAGSDSKSPPENGTALFHKGDLFRAGWREAFQWVLGVSPYFKSCDAARTKGRDAPVEYLDVAFNPVFSRMLRCLRRISLLLLFDLRHI
jgi:hypothetical protein